MSRSELAEALDGLLKLRNRSYSGSSRFVADLGFDSYELVALMLEVEAILDTELDEAMLVFFAEATMGEICARLAD
jgi:acyl carrier protein